MSQQRVADACGVTMRTQRNYENGDRSPDASYLIAVAALGVDVQFVLTNERLPEALRDSYRRAAIATLNTTNPDLAREYVRSLPKLQEQEAERQQQLEAERRLLRDFRGISPADQATITQLAERLAAGKRPRRSDSSETNMVFHAQVGSVNKLDQGDMHVTHNHVKPPKDKKPPK